MIPSLPKLLGLIAIIWVVWTVFRIYETRQATIRAQQTKDGDESRHDAPHDAAGRASGPKPDGYAGTNGKVGGGASLKV